MNKVNTGKGRRGEGEGLGLHTDQTCQQREELLLLPPSVKRTLGPVSLVARENSFQMEKGGQKKELGIGYGMDIGGCIATFRLN
jgi:hypothetical protein